MHAADGSIDCQSAEAGAGGAAVVHRRAIRRAGRCLRALPSGAAGGRRQYTLPDDSRRVVLL